MKYKPIFYRVYCHYSRGHSWPLQIPDKGPETIKIKLGFNVRRRNIWRANSVRKGERKMFTRKLYPGSRGDVNFAYL